MLHMARRCWSLYNSDEFSPGLKPSVGADTGTTEAKETTDAELSEVKLAAQQLHKYEPSAK